MLHGYGSRKESFFYQIEYLSKYFTVTAPDFPGFGASAPLDNPWSVGDYAQWLKEFMEAAKLNGAHILAHSFGARVAFKLFADYPELAEKIVITGGAGLVKERSAQYIRRVKAYRRIKKLFPRYAEKHYGSAEYRTLSPIMRESYKKIVNEDLRECAARIKNKTLLVYGENDSATPPAEEGEIFRSLIPGSKLEIMSGTHFCFCERPDVFNGLVLNFYNS